MLPVGDGLPQGLPVSVIHIGSLLQQLVELGEVSLQPMRGQYYSNQPIRGACLFTRGQELIIPLHCSDWTEMGNLHHFDFLSYPVICGLTLNFV